MMLTVTKNITLKCYQAVGLRRHFVIFGNNLLYFFLIYELLEKSDHFDHLFFHVEIDM